jgi:hypothetical protein
LESKVSSARLSENFLSCTAALRDIIAVQSSCIAALKIKSQAKGGGKVAS